MRPIAVLPRVSSGRELKKLGLLFDKYLVLERPALAHDPDLEFLENAGAIELSETFPKSIAHIWKGARRPIGAIWADILYRAPENGHPALFPIVPEGLPWLPVLKALRPVTEEERIQAEHWAMRNEAVSFSRSHGVETVLVPSQWDSGPLEMFEPSSDHSKYETVCNIVLSAFPTPSDLSSWQDIWDFKNDPESEQTLRRLVVWMRRFGRDKREASIEEIRDEIKCVLDDYEAALKRCRVKTSRVAFRAILTGFAEVFDRLPLLNLSAILKVPVTISREKELLLDEERKLPGCELAYLVKARETFER